MPYIENRLVHDADSHLMEMSDCLNPYFEKSLLTRFLEHPNLGVRVGNRLAIEDAQKRQEDALFRASAGENIMLRKNYEAQGAFLKADRPAAIDHIGVASQLVFTTFCLGNFGRQEWRSNRPRFIDNPRLGIIRSGFVYRIDLHQAASGGKRQLIVTKKINSQRRESS